MGGCKKEGRKARRRRRILRGVDGKERGGRNPEGRVTRELGGTYFLGGEGEGRGTWKTKKRKPEGGRSDPAREGEEGWLRVTC